MQSEDLIQTLVAIRRRLRIWLVVDGASRLILSGAAAFAVLVFLDWWVHFPWFVRLAALGAGAIGALIWTLRRIVRPALASVSLDHLALRLGRLSPVDRDRLAAAVAYLREGGGAGSPELWERVIAKTLDFAGTLPLTVGLNPKRANRMLLCTVSVAAFLSAAYAAAPSLMNIGWRRLSSPLSAASWPKTVSVEPLTGDALVAFGEDFTVKMRVRAGDSPRLRGTVVSTRPGAAPEANLMRRDAAGVYHYTFQRIRLPMLYWFVAGDDNAGDSRFSIRVARRPAVASARIVLASPDYAPDHPDRVVPLADRPVTTVFRSYARLEVRPVRPFQMPEASGSPQLLVFDDGRRIVLREHEPGGGDLTARFLVERPGTFEIRLTDANGLRSRTSRRYRLLVREDEPPTVSIIEPAETLDLTPRAVLHIGVEAADDLGVASLRLLAGLNGDAPVETAAFSADDLEEAFAVSRTDVRIRSAWRLSDLPRPPAPGDVLEFVAEVTDNFLLDGRRHPPVRSPLKRARIVSVSELAELLHQAVFETRGTLRDLLLDLRAARDRAADLDLGPAADRPLGDRERQALETLDRELRRVTMEARDLADRLGEVANRADVNRASRLDVALQAARFADQLMRLGKEALPSASASLSQAADAADAQEQHTALQGSIHQQDLSTATLSAMLEGLERWNAFTDIARLLRELLDRQETAIRDVVRLIPTMGGLAVDQLDVDQTAELLRARVWQEQIGQDMDSAMHHAETLAASLVATDHAAAVALRQAVEVSNRLSVSEMMSKAAEEIGRNRLSRARRRQERAAAGLRAALSALEEKPDRQLAELSRQLEDVLGRLRKLIQVQQDLILRATAYATSEVSSERFGRLIDRQTSLAALAVDLMGRVKASSLEGISAKAELGAAAAHMRTAGERFEAGALPHGLTAQRAALASLEEAMKQLRILQERTDQWIAERSLADIVERLVELRTLQSEIRGETVALQKRRPTSTRMTRLDGLKLNALARRQDALGEPIDAVMQKMSGSVVYRHVCEEMKAEANQATQRLRAHDCSSAVDHQKRVLVDLNRLIEAVEDRPVKPRGRYADVEGGGGGAAAPKIGKPVPPLAELKVLRMLQVELGEKTRALAESLPDPLLQTEDQLRQAEALGEKQRAIHHLAVRMVTQAAGAEGP